MKKIFILILIAYLLNVALVSARTQKNPFHVVKTQLTMALDKMHDFRFHDILSKIK
ncbi:hypothetical protein [Fusobacterium sp. PH5-44]|uniref:hypothetical protein n=1 Tax=unclassified Fusobacterium TaxID=2648384 RepID=UPI003D23D799